MCCASVVVHAPLQARYETKSHGVPRVVCLSCAVWVPFPLIVPTSRSSFPNNVRFWNGIFASAQHCDCGTLRPPCVIKGRKARCVWCLTCWHCNQDIRAAVKFDRFFYVTCFLELDTQVLLFIKNSFCCLLVNSLGKIQDPRPKRFLSVHWSHKIRPLIGLTESSCLHGHQHIKLREQISSYYARFFL